MSDRDSAWLVDLKSGERQIASVGESAFGFTVTAIRSDAALLRRDGQELELRLGPPNVQALSGPYSERELGNRPTQAAAPTPGGNYNPVTVNTYVNVYPPDYGVRDYGELDERNAPRFSSRASDHDQLGNSPVVVILGGRGGRSPYGWNSPNWGTYRNRYPLTRPTRRNGVRISSAADEALDLPEPIVNPQTERRLGVVGAAASQSRRPGYGSPGSYVTNPPGFRR